HIDLLTVKKRFNFFIKDISEGISGIPSCKYAVTTFCIALEMGACLSKMIQGICLITAVCTVLSSGSIPSTFISTVRNFVTTSWKRCDTILPVFQLSQRFTSKDIFILFCLVITCFTMLYASVIAVGSGVVISKHSSGASTRDKLV